MRLIDDISIFLENQGFACSHQKRGGFEVICTSTLDGREPRLILPLEISAPSEDDAYRDAEAASGCISAICEKEGYPLIITEDRWHSQGAMTRSRLLAHLEVFCQAYARNCEVRKIDKTVAKEFLEANHSYGDAACRYRYGLFLKRYTGKALGSARDDRPEPGTLVAVATFSNARKWKKGDKEIRSYEWTRYASIPGLRINGGMGKLLKTFIKEVAPDDIMSYADLEWSEGNVYSQLGFILEGHKEPVTFMVDTRTWKRFPVRPGMTGPDGSGMKEPDGSDMNGQDGSGMKEEDRRFFRNFGSNKYRFKLTEYE